MRRAFLGLAALALLPTTAFAVGGQVLINQSTLNAAGGTFTITQPGSYELSGNLDTNVIVIGTDNVPQHEKRGWSQA